MRRAKKILLVGLAAVFGLVALGIAYQQLGQMRDLRRYPATGEMVEVNGVRLHLDCQGAGSPTVVAEAGLSDFSVSWKSFQESASSLAKTCIYDRGGLGWSEFDPRMATAEHVAEALKELLLNGGIDGPYVLIGHSLGGVYIREFAARFPADVAGLVLVDSSHENQIGRNSFLEPFTSDPLAIRMGACRLLAPFGVVRLFDLMNIYLWGDTEMTAEVRGIYTAAKNRTHFCATLRMDRLAVIGLLDQREPPRSLGGLPMIVLTRALPDGLDDWSSDRSSAWESLWLELQTELAALSTAGRHRLVEGAGHDIVSDRPDAVIGAIREIIEESRQR